MTSYVDQVKAQAVEPVAEAEKHSMRYTVWSVSIGIALPSHCKINGHFCSPSQAKTGLRA